MLPAMERCGECGFEYDEAAAPEAAAVIRDGAAELAAILRLGQAGLGSRREWSMPATSATCCWSSESGCWQPAAWNVR